MNEPAITAVLTLPSKTVSVARRHVRTQLAAWDLEELVHGCPADLRAGDDMLVHTGGDGQLGIERHGDGVRVTVVDTSAVLPTQRRHSNNIDNRPRLPAAAGPV